MGGTGSEEFMVESEIGDNTLLLCKACDYAANVEKAGCKPDYAAPASIEAANAAAATIPALEKIDTPHVRTIEELCGFLKTDAKQFIKTLIYKAINVELDLSDAPGTIKFEKLTGKTRKLSMDMPVEGGGDYRVSLTRNAGDAGTSAAYPEAFFAVAIRGDLDVNEVKLAAILKAAEVVLAADTDVERITGAPVGFAGPVGLTTVPIIADETVTAMTDAVAGALAKDLHYTHAAYGRDFTPWRIADVRTVVAGDRCPVCGGELYEKKGNELGHIFKLGQKYTKSMKVSYLDENGKSHTPTMGCYGIGLDRTLASAIEEHHDETGIIWPITIAPFHVIIVPIKYDGAVKAAADSITADLEKRGVEVLLDDRNERPGVKFNDADLTGIPYRVVIGDKNLAGDTPKVEIKGRGEKENRLVELKAAAEELTALVQRDLAGR
jgi:prolyl-tRNA synthetase